MKLKLFAVLFGLLTLAACSKTRKSNAVPARTAVPVTTLTVAPSEIPSLYTVSGTVRAKTVSTLSSKVLASVRSVRVREGDRVRAGQVLVTLDSEDLDARYNQAQSAHQESVSALPEAESAISEAKANLDLAEVTFRRMQDLYAKRSISDQEFDEATAKIKSVRAGYSIALARNAQVKNRMAQAEAALRSAAVNQNYSRIVAPFSGVVSAKNVDPGVLAVPGAPLLTLEGAGNYRFEAPVEESRLSSIRLGEKSSIALDALDCKVDGRVSEVAPVVDVGSRSYMVKIDLPAIPKLRSGLFGRASFESRPQKMIAIPAAAISRNGQLESVFVVEQGVVELRLITAGRNWGGRAEILSGLHPGDQLIYPVPAGLREGKPVEVRPAPEVR
jgi:RND family efflux transporter MFP subunit